MNINSGKTLIDSLTICKLLSILDCSKINILLSSCRHNTHGTGESELSRVANQLLESVQDPQIANTEFMNFMKQISAGEVGCFTDLLHFVFAFSNVDG